MKTVTDRFKEEIVKLGREIDFKFLLHTNDKLITENGNFLMTENNRHLVVEQFNDTEIDEVIEAEDIYNVSIVNRGNILSTMMKELDFELKNDLRVGDVIECEFGLKVDGTYEYINYGKYMVYSKEFNEDTKTYSYIAYDRMLLTMQEISQEFLIDLEGRTLANCINVLCGKVGLTYNATEQELTDYPNLSKEINEGTFTDMQMTYRDVLDQICQALGLSMIVDGKQLKLKPLEDNSEYIMPYELDGNTTQNGIPTPTNPVEIQNVTGTIIKHHHSINLGNIELCKIGTYQDKIKKSTGKNLFYTPTNTPSSLYGIGITRNSDGSITLNGRSTQAGGIIFDLDEPIALDGTYTFSIKTVGTISTNGQVQIILRKSDNTSLLLNPTIGTNQTRPITKEVHDTASRLQIYCQANITLDCTIYLQLEKNNTVTDYEPYGEVWYLHKEIGKTTLTGEENWQSISNTSYSGDILRFRCNDFTNVYYVSSNTPYILSNYFEGVPLSTRTKNGVARQLDSSGLNIFIDKTITNDLDNFKTWVGNNNVIVYYVSAMSIDTVITDSTLIQQLNDAEIVTNTIDENYIKDTNVSFGEKYMINSVVLSRSEDTDNIYRRDEESVAENGVHEYKIKDNLIMLYDDREDYIDEIFEQLNGLEYYINDYSSTGITYLDWLDFYNVQIGDKTYKCLMLNDEIKIDQGLEEEVYSEMPEETVTPYKTSAKTDKEVSFIVDKQNGSIKAKVNKGEVINEINLDETGAEINANKISLAGKEIKLTGDDITISSTNFNVDSSGNITANNVTLNSGTFKGDVNTSQNCTVGDDLYVGQNQSTSYAYTKGIIFSNDTRINKLKIGTTEAMSLFSHFININALEGVNIGESTSLGYRFASFSDGSFNLKSNSGNTYITGGNGFIDMSHQPSWPRNKRYRYFMDR